MRNLLLAISLLVGGCVAPPAPHRGANYEPKIVNYETDGNLESDHPLGCATLSEITNEHTPADLYPAVARCIAQGNYAAAIPLYLLAGARGRFDQLRVTDSTAHQAIQALQLKSIGSVPDDKKSQMKVAITSATEPGSTNFSELCSEIARKGPPEYYPRYMVQHGMAATDGTSGNKIVADFNAANGWHDSLTGYLHCDQ